MGRLCKQHVSIKVLCPLTIYASNVASTVLSSGDDADRATKSYGRNAGRLIKAKRRYDPDNLFRSAIPLPVDRNNRPARVAANARPAPAPEDV